MTIPFSLKYYPLRFFLLLLLIASLSGCVYTRLLAFKNQFAEFDTSFRVETSDHFILHMNDPVLERGDLTYLSKLEPTRVNAIAEGERTTYVMQQLDGDGHIKPSGVEIIFDMDFNQQGLMNKWSFSPIFLAIAPAEFLELSLRSLGTAEIFKTKRQVKADLSQVEKLQAPLPTRQAIVDTLGEPLSIRERKDSQRYLYHFKLDSTSTGQKLEARKLTVVKLDFDKKTDEMVKMSGRFAGMKISIDYRKLTDRG